MVVIATSRRSSLIVPRGSRTPSPIIQLWKDVQDALTVVPSRFHSPLYVEGVIATDLHTFNSSLGSSIEQAVVDALNELRDDTWDARKVFRTYSFVRQPQRFPDVILRSEASNPPFGEIIMGIELKGWYVMAKEREPSYRFKVSPHVCAPLDLLAVYPWAFSNVVAGTPRLYTPYIIGAREGAERRNGYWQHIRKARSSRAITPAPVVRFYPNKDDRISDVPASDPGNNFGRLARSGLMDEFNQELFTQRLYGIPLDAWQRFFAVFSESYTQSAIDRFIESLTRQRQRSLHATLRTQEQIDKMRDLLEQMADILGVS